MDWKRQSGRDIQQLIFRTTMSRIHITFVGGQPIPVYQGITATNPNKIIFIYSKQSEDILHRIKKAIEQTFNQQKMPSVETISLSPTDPHMIQEIATKLSAAHANDDISLNITSGPKSWTYLFGIQFCKQNNTTIFYIDQNNILWNYSSMEEEKTLFPDMKTLFYLQGTLPPTQYIDFKDFAPEDSRVVMQITELIHVNTNNYFRLVALARNQTGTTEFSLPNKSFLRWNKTEKSFDIQITSAREDLRHTLKSPHVRQLLLKAGWFEYKVAQILSTWNQAKTIWTNCVFPYANASAKNEIDIIVDTGIKLLFVECKTQIEDNTDIDKFKSASENYGGKGCKTLFITEKRIKDNALEKCRDNKILTFSFEEYTSDSIAKQALFNLLNNNFFNINA